jgi:hypothetical protein
MPFLAGSCGFTVQRIALDGPAKCHSRSNSAIHALCQPRALANLGDASRDVGESETISLPAPPLIDEEGQGLTVEAGKFLELYHIHPALA